MRREEFMATHTLSTLASFLGRPGRSAPPEERRDFADIRMAGPHDKTVTQAEIQHEVQRFTGDFMERIAEGAEPIVGTTVGHDRRSVLQQVLVYAAAAMEIATEPTPELALLDMNVFLALSSGVLEGHWIPNVFGETGKPLLRAFECATDELRSINSRVLKPEIQSSLSRIIASWQSENPGRVRVESVRLHDFLAGDGKASRQQASDTRGLLRDVKASIKAVDEALLLADRAMFLAQREPFLIRWQVRLGASEIVGDSLEDLSGMQALLSRALDAQPLLKEVSVALENSRAMVVESRKTVRAAQGVLEGLRPVLGRLPSKSDVEETLAGVNRLVAGTHALLNDFRASLVGDQAAAALAFERRADHLLRRCVLYLAALGAVWTLLFWGGYCVSKHLVGTRPAPADSHSEMKPRGHTP